MLSIIMKLMTATHYFHRSTFNDYLFKHERIMASDAGVRNIEQLAQFGKNIKNLGQNMYQTMQVAQQRMNAVSEGWQDKQNDKFREEFNRSVQDIKKMSEMFTEYSNYIAKITSKLMEYQNIR